MNLRVLLFSLITLVVVSLSLFSWSAYHSYKVIHSDDPISPEFRVEHGAGKAIRGDRAYDMVGSESLTLEDADIVETLADSEAMITRPDKSITRMGEKTRIVIRKMFANRTYSDIRIAYDMERGKVWNTVVRTLLGDSYFEVTLPKQSVVAGVRGSVFEINLENRYIHAVEHATLLADKTGNQLSLLPGELVDSENIWVKKGREWLDTKWNEWNSAKDEAYRALRSLDIEKRFSNLSGSGGKMLTKLNRTLLKKIKGFDDLEIAEMIRRGDVEGLKSYSTETLIGALQHIPDVSKSTDRERIRSVLLQSDIDAKLRDSLDMNALWESLDTGRLSDQAKKYLESKGVDMPELQSKLLERAKSDIGSVLSTLSGGVNVLFSR